VTNLEVKPKVHLNKLHDRQKYIKDSLAKRKIIRAGRRFGKTILAARLAVEALTHGRRILYGTPTGDQLDTFWYEVCWSLQELINAGIYKKNETKHIIEHPGTKARIKGKTCWNADTLRGDFGDLLILDEYQLMNEDTWKKVGAPMLLDNDGDAIFIYTPPSLHSKGVSKAKDPQHAGKLFKSAKEDKSGRWDAFSYSSMENPYISKDALDNITGDMDADAYRREILAIEDDDDFKGLIYKCFRNDLQIIKRFDIPKDWPVRTGHDFGKANAAALFAARVTLDLSGKLPEGVHPYLKPNDLVLFAEYSPDGGLSPAQRAEKWKDTVRGYRVEDSRGGNPNESENRDSYTSHGFRIDAPLLSSVKAGIGHVKTFFELNKIWVFSDLYGTLYQLANYSWKLNEEGQITGEILDKAKYHYLDCIRAMMTGVKSETVNRGYDKELPPQLNYLRRN